jgi:hypothetical protein
MSIKNILLSASLMSPNVETMKNHLLLDGDLVPEFDINSLKGNKPSSSSHDEANDHAIKKSSHINRLKDSHLYMYKNEPVYYSNPTPVYEEYANQEVYEQPAAVYDQNQNAGVIYQQEENTNGQQVYPSADANKQEPEEEKYKKKSKKGKKEKKSKKSKLMAKHETADNTEVEEETKSPSEVSLKAESVVLSNPLVESKATAVEDSVATEANKKLTSADVAKLLSLISDLNAAAVKAPLKAVDSSVVAKQGTADGVQVIKSQPVAAGSAVKQEASVKLTEPVKMSAKPVQIKNLTETTGKDVSKLAETAKETSKLEKALADSSVKAKA